MGPASVRAVMTKDFMARRFALRKELKLTTRPVLTLTHFGQAVCEGVGGLELPRLGAVHGWALVSLVVVAVLQAQARRGAYGATVAARAAAAAGVASYCCWWFACGVLSTVGLGTGLQTGALFLFPHVARVALDWHRTGGAAFARMWRERWFVRNLPAAAAPAKPVAAAERSVVALLAHVALPGVLSGTGSAVGELVPFVVARAMVRGGHDPFALLNADDDDDETGAAAPRRTWTPGILVAKTRSALEAQLRTASFAKIFVLAAIPNPLFDLCALVCGATGVPFATFFAAVFAAKALLRTPLQTCAVALVAAKLAEKDLEAAPGRASARKLRDTLSKSAPPTAAAAARRTALVLARHGWTALLAAFALAFVASTVEQIAQQRAVARLQHLLDSRPVADWPEVAGRPQP